MAVHRTLPLLVSLLLPAAGAAETFVVDRLDDAEDLFRADGVCSTVPPGGCTVRAAFMEAAALGGDHVVELGPGVHHVVLGGSDNSGGINPRVGDLDWTGPGHLEVRGAGPTLTELRSDGYDRVLEVREASLTLSGVSLTRGQVGWNGGNLRVSGGSITVRDCHFVDGESSFGGGGVFLEDSQARFAECAIRWNRAAHQGAGISVEGGSTRMERCIVADNTTAMDALGQGGGIYVAGGDVEIVASAILRNHAGHGSGGGLECERATIRLLDSTVSHNASDWYGGGISILLGAASLHGCTVVANADPQGGNIVVVDGHLEASHSVLQRCATIIETKGWNFLWDSPACSLVGLDVGSITGDPLLGPLADNGGPTPTHLPLPGSPLIDAGSPAGCISTDSVVRVADQRGVARPQDGDVDGTARCDIGAIELVATDLDGDGVDDGSDCAPMDPDLRRIPAEVSGLRLAVTAGGVLLTWDDPTPRAGAATRAVVASGALAGLPTPGACLVRNLAATSWIDGAPAGDRWYLVRAVNSCGEGPWGTDSFGVPRPGCP